MKILKTLFSKKTTASNIEFIGLEPIGGKELYQIEIITKEQLIDLHNACEFIEYKHNKKDKSLQLLWHFYFDYENALFRKVGLICQNISSMDISAKDLDVPRTEDECLEKTYTYDTHGICFEFRGGQVFNITCDTVTYFEPSNSSM